MVRSSTVITILVASLLAKLILYAFGVYDADDTWQQVSAVGNVATLFFVWYLWAVFRNKRVV